LLILALALAGCQPADSPPETTPAAEAPSSGDWLIFGDTVEPGSLNCLRSTERAARQICRLVGDSLIDFDQDFRFVPRLAESWDVSDGGLTLTFHLRRGVSWHDGKPFTSRDVLRTLDALKAEDPGGETFRLFFGPLSDVAAPDDWTIVASYDEPFSGALVGWRETIIMPAHIPLEPGQPSVLDREPIGTGPFRFLSWSPQQEIVLAANEAYFGGRPYLDRYVQRIVPSIDALQAAVATGDIDVTGLPSDWLLRNNPEDPALPFLVRTYPTSLMEMIYWNMGEPRGLFKDRRVRRAMTMLLDRKGYVEKIHHGLYRQATTLIDPSLWGGDPAMQPLAYDPDAAARLLDEAGVVDRDGDGVRDTADGPFSFTLIYASVAPSQKEIASLLERSAAAIGVRVNLQGLEWAVMKPRVADHDFEAAIYRWRLEPFPDPYAYFHSSQIAGGFNFGSYRSDTFDRLAEEARRTLAPERTAEILVELQRILHEDQPCTFVSIPGAVVAVHKRFRTPEMTAAGLWNWYPSLQRWWVPARQRKYH